MLNILITENRVQIVDSVSSWEESVRLLCTPLLDDGSIEPRYVDEIIKTTNEIGPYYVLAPNIAMPHARPENGVNKSGLAILVVRDGVNFNSEENDPVKLLLLLAANDSDKHIELIQSISEFFGNDVDVNEVITSKNISDVMNIIKKY
ncbi:PTS sugar transporter subunit IIA [Vibrio natriegens]|uniref:PTS sugar transporter subunit IIA n=1 Tax=Vibrio natriegens TaxID=691 RepID=UPI0035571180